MSRIKRLSAARVVLCLLVFTSLISCRRQSAEVELVPVAGELFVGGQPAIGAQLAFSPMDGGPADRWTAGYPRAVVDQGGKFVVETFQPGDGCPLGEYTVLVIWPAASDAESSEVDDQETVDRLGGRYATPESSSLKAKVESKPTDLGRYDIK